MNTNQCERAINALLSALERLEKEASTPAHYEAMAKVAGALVKLHACEIRRESVMGAAVSKEDLGRSTVITLRHIGDAEREDDVDRELLRFLKKLRRKGAGFEYMFKRRPSDRPTQVFESNSWREV